MIEKEKKENLLREEFIGFVSKVSNFHIFLLHWMCG